MSVSGKMDFQMPVGTVITQALQELNAVARGQDPDAEQIQHARVRLNAMIQSWHADRLNVWTRTRGTLLLQAGLAYYKFDAYVRELLIAETQIRRLGTVGADGEPSAPLDYPLVEISRRDYYQLPQRGTKGRPVQLMQDRTRTLASGTHDLQGCLTVFLYPTPDQADTLLFTAVRRYNDAVNANDDLDFPTQWGLALIYGLARELIGRYAQSVTNAQRIEARYREQMKIVRGDDSERGPLEIRPAYSTFRGGW